jgi:hypothetical protein
MNTKPTTTSKLTLTRESLRELTATDLQRVAAGLSPAGTETCGTNCCGGRTHPQTQ